MRETAQITVSAQIGRTLGTQTVENTDLIRRFCEKVLTPSEVGAASRMWMLFSADRV
jgi:hypothetical protein